VIGLIKVFTRSAVVLSKLFKRLCLVSENSYNIHPLFWLVYVFKQYTLSPLIGLCLQTMYTLSSDWSVSSNNVHSLLWLVCVFKQYTLFLLIGLCLQTMYTLSSDWSMSSNNIHSLLWLVHVFKQNTLSSDWSISSNSIHTLLWLGYIFKQYKPSPLIVSNVTWQVMRVQASEW